MTPDDFREARRKLGLTASKLATALELGADGGRTVRRWEHGERGIPGPVAVALRYMLAEREAASTAPTAAAGAADLPAP